MPADTPAKPRRGRGRPRGDPSGDAAVVTRRAIVELACDQARTRSIEAISFVELARRLDIAPGSVHYHVGTKDDLTSAILNRFYATLVEALSACDADGPWRERLAAFARTLMRVERAHRGPAEHIQTKPRYRVFQKAVAGEIDHGARYLDLAFSLFRDTGFTSEQSALFYHSLAMHCLASANSAAARLEPAAHERFLLDKAADSPAHETPGLAHALVPFARIRADAAFEFGLEALLDRFAAERAPRP